MKASCGFAWRPWRFPPTAGESGSTTWRWHGMLESLQDQSIRWVDDQIWSDQVSDCAKREGHVKFQHLSWDLPLPEAITSSDPGKSVSDPIGRLMTAGEVSCYLAQHKVLTTIWPTGDHWHRTCQQTRYTRNTWPALREAPKGMWWLKEVRLFQSARFTRLVPDMETWSISD